MKEITIKSKTTVAKISTMGAEIISICSNGQERIWQGDAKYWAKHAPVPFPFCGRLIDDEYEYEGKKYTGITNHGFAKDSDFTITNQKDDSVTMVLKTSENTKKVYPFDWTLEITYEIEGDKIKIAQKVCNCGEKLMPYNTGRHEAYAIDGDIADYRIRFPESFNEGVTATKLEGRFLKREYYAFNIQDALWDKWYEKGNDAPGTIVLENMLTNRVHLEKRDGDEYKPVAKIYFPGYEHLLFWRVPGAGYIAIEPWSGLPDVCGRENPDIFAKEGINVLKPGEFRVHRSEIEFA